ncbi:MAG: DUF6933 domain-containing protein [Coprobacillaceae bacterium]
MNLYRTKKLLDAGNYKIESNENSDPLFSWYGNKVKVNRKNFIAFINEKTGYPLFFYRMKKKELLNIEFYIEFAIEYAFKGEGYPLELIFHYLDRGSKTRIHKIASRKTLGHLKEMIFYSTNQEYWELVDNCFNISSLSYILSDTYMKMDNEYICPKDEMLKELLNDYEIANAQA